MRLPVFLGRRPSEPADQDVAAFYGPLLQKINRDVFRNGEWRLCERTGWPDNQSCRNILTWYWVKDTEYFLIVMNFSEATAQARAQVPWEELRGKTWHLTDVLSDEAYDRSGDEMRDAGLYVELGPGNATCSKRVRYERSQARHRTPPVHDGNSGNDPARD